MSGEMMRNRMSGETMRRNKTKTVRRQARMGKQRDDNNEQWGAGGAQPHGEGEKR